MEGEHMEELQLLKESPSVVPLTVQVNIYAVSHCEVKEDITVDQG